MKVVHVIVHGRVQGVGYRAWVENEAGGLGLDGWVRNRREGTVEALFAGEEGRVASMVTLSRAGPSMARVDFIEEQDWAEPVEPGFAVLPTI